jgi:hypothetical protein
MRGEERLMQTRIVTRPAIAAMALVIAWTAAPRATIAQQCRRTCEAGETRDVRGCCVPAAKPVRQKPRPARSAQPARPTAKAERPPRPAREAPDAEAPANKPSEPSTARPSPPPAGKASESSPARPSAPPVGKASESSPARPSPPPAGKPSESPAVKPNRLPSEPGPSEPSASKSSAPTRDAGSRTVTVPGDASGTPPTVQESPRAGAAPTIHAPGSTQTETSSPRRDEPGPTQAQGFENSSKYQQLEPRPTTTPETGEKDSRVRPGEESSKSFDELLAEAQNAARAGLYGKARRLCSLALEKQPGDVNAVTVCAIAACNVGDTRWAKRYYAMASADQKHAIYNICSAKGIDLLKEAPPVNKSDEVLVSETDEPSGHKSNEPLAPETPDATQRPQTGLPPGAAAMRNPSTEPPVTTRTEPMAPSRPDAERPVDVRPGMLEPPRLALAPSAPVVEQEPRRRWPVWMPWAVVGVGAVVSGAGGLMYSKAADEYAEFDRKFTDNCLNIAGCYDGDNPPEFFDHLDRARTLETASRLSFIGGGVTVAVGAALVFLNHSTEPERERIMARTFVVPTLDAGVAGLSAAISF